MLIKNTFPFMFKLDELLITLRSWQKIIFARVAGKYMSLTSKLLNKT